MEFKVLIRLTDGTEEYFDTFVSMEYAIYNIHLAKTCPDSVYRNEKYEDAKWIVKECNNG